ncbi:hypothetical protein MXB_2056, partial [Myxobolus squamalis]
MNQQMVYVKIRYSCHSSIHDQGNHRYVMVLTGSAFGKINLYKCILDSDNIQSIEFLSSFSGHN